MEENKILVEHGTYWAAKILCVHRKNWLEKIRNKLFIVFTNQFANTILV